MLATHAYDAFTGISIPGLTARGAARQHLHLLGFRTRQIIGYFGNVDAPLPDAIVWLWVAAAGALVAASLWLGRWLQRLAVVGLVGFVMVLPLVSEMSRAPTYGFIWQGRYSLPVAVGVPVLAAWIVADRLDVALVALRRALVAVVAVLAGAAQLAAHLSFMTRVVVGYPNPWWKYLTGDGWRPPLSVWVLLTWAVLASAAYGAVLWVSGRDEPVSTAAPGPP